MQINTLMLDIVGGRYREAEVKNNFWMKPA